jgi:glutamyl-tRNA reductase
MMHSFSNKLLHVPTTEIHRRAGGCDESEYVETVRRLFGLDDAGDAS